MTDGLTCPRCHGATTVIDSRGTVLGDLPTIRRRRRCAGCDHRFTTYELQDAVIAAVEQRLEAIDTLRTMAQRPVSLTEPIFRREARYDHR
ncbi:NrdR family transcriptional regulator [Pararhodobacter marinus]|uniref:NrdR family transcriptional regulator n=1 Tax=Pararhodobacter marinus TaxID=2184063 RepID=UPI003515271B